MSVYVGTSELPGRTFGVKQYMSNEQAGWQLIGAMNEIEEALGSRPTINEADRSRPGQLYMYDQYLHHGGALAAFCSIYPLPNGRYDSTHDPINHGNAADIGGPGGVVLGQAHHDALAKYIGPKYGVVWTGATFWRPERWHFNIYPERASIIVPAGTAIGVKKATPTIRKDEEEFLMKIITDGKTGQLLEKQGGYQKFTSPDEVKFLLATKTPVVKVHTKTLKRLVKFAN